MHLDIIQYYYSALKGDSYEADVDRIWNTILPMYFGAHKNYGIEQQPRPQYPGASDKQADFLIRFIIRSTKSGASKKVVLIEDKRVGEERSTATWQSAVGQLTDYMVFARTHQASPPGGESMFAIVTIGHFSRFYELRPGESELVDYPGTTGDPLEFKKDEETIDALLVQIVGRTSH
ncbi:hypothetical protein GGR56DRAFT_660653 [Xylariaceae sp. FL0804]|nr:hypothetical protein GGR56DRAFT_660653 [Xylariaceae sp. FL0804]